MVKLKCRGCTDRFDRESMIKIQLAWYHSYECASAHGLAKAKRRDNATTIANAKALRSKLRADRDRVKRRSEWMDNLQTVVNQYVLHVRDKGKPCCTCGKERGVKFDAGHMRSRGACPELRFELTNIHAQCSINCNQHGSGMRHEYREFITTEYGADHLEWLDGPHPSLKEIFPHYIDIKNEIARYRKLLRAEGIKPNY